MRLNGKGRFDSPAWYLRLPLSCSSLKLARVSMGFMRPPSCTGRVEKSWVVWSCHWGRAWSWADAKDEALTLDGLTNSDFTGSTDNPMDALNSLLLLIGFIGGGLLLVVCSIAVGLVVIRVKGKDGPTMDISLEKQKKLISNVEAKQKAFKTKKGKKSDIVKSKKKQ